MIGYVCKYTPVELIKAFGVEAIKIEPQGQLQERAHDFTHVNMCSFMKGALGEILEHNIPEVVLVNCCDSIRRLYDILKGKTDFLHIIDLPRKITNETNQLFYREILAFTEAYAEYKGTKLKTGLLKEIIQSHKNRQFPGEKSLVIIGARLEENILNKIEERYKVKIVNLTCSGKKRPVEIPAKIINEENLFFAYAGALLHSFPCMRMVSDRQTFLKSLPIKGIIYNTIKFCDFYSFEYADLKKLKIAYLKSGNRLHGFPKRTAYEQDRCLYGDTGKKKTRLLSRRNRFLQASTAAQPARIQ